MTSSQHDSSSIFEGRTVPVGLGIIGAVAFGLLVFQVGLFDGEPSAQEDPRAVPPPMPTTQIEVVENEVIEQEEIDYGAALRLSTRGSAH